MADVSDELIIRHVRLCECGKIAGHDSICRPVRVPVGLEPDDVQPIDAEVEEGYARRREERHVGRQPGFRAERHAQRALMSNQQLQAQAAIRAAKLSPVGAGNVAPSHGAGGHPSRNLALQARGVTLEQDPRWNATDQAERRALLRKHELLDEYEGLGPARSDPDLTPEAKDAAIVSPQHEDLTATEFARQFPGYGSPGTIARKRRWFAGGYCTFSGLPPRPGCHCPTCRGAIT